MKKTLLKGLLVITKLLTPVHELLALETLFLLDHPFEIPDLDIENEKLTVASEWIDKIIIYPGLGCGKILIII